MSLVIGDNNFKDATVVIVGHGSTKNDNSGESARQHAAELRERKIFAEVKEGFLKQEPELCAVAASIATPRAFFVPLFVCEGYFTEEILPAKLGFKQSEETAFRRVKFEHGKTCYYCEVVGTHPSMTDVLLRRAREVLVAYPFPRAPKESQISLIIAGHGTEKNSNSRRAIENQVELLRARNIYADVHAVFIEEAPRIEAAYTLASASNVVVVPFFMSEGLHVQEDIPILLGEARRFIEERLKSNLPVWRNPSEKKGKRVWYARAVGTEKGIADVLIQRVREASSANV